MPAQGSARNAALTFLDALARGDAESLWMFASEEEHDAFQTEQVAFAAYADAFPALTRAKRVEVARAWQEGDTPFFELAVTDTGGERYRATLGLWRDDAGDWKIVSAAVVALSDRVASR